MGSDFGHIVTKYEGKIREMEEKMSRMKEMYEESMDKMQLRLDAWQIRAVRPKKARLGTGNAELLVRVT